MLTENSICVGDPNRVVYANYGIELIDIEAHVKYRQEQQPNGSVWHIIERNVFDVPLGGDAVWGDITGTLSAQTDLQDALDDKYDADNPDGFITGINSGDVTTALGFTPENVANKQTNLTSSSSKYPTVDAVNTGLATKQDVLSSGTTIKTVNSTSLLGSGDVPIFEVPDSFTFTAQTGANPSTVTSSNTVTLNGDTDVVWPFVIRGDGTPQLSINGGTWASEGLGRDADTLQVRLTSSSSSLTLRTATLYTNKFSTAFNVTTAEFLLLDIYGTDIASAYSLRKLKVAYAGSAIRVRRSSDNAEQDIGFSGNDLDTSALTTFVGVNSAYVTTWYDQSGNSRNAVQATTARQPRIVNAGTIETLNSKPTVYSSDINGNLKATFTLNQPTNFFAVWNVNALPATRMAFDGTNASETAMEIKTSGGNHGEVYGGAYLTQTYPITVGTPLLTSILFNGASSNTYKNGSSYATGNAGTVNPTGVTLFNYSGLNFGMDGFISEFLAYSSDKASDLSGINANINAYYSIY